MSEHTIPAPALRGDDPLGFLASVGITALSFVQAIPPVRLGWSDGFSPHAVFTSNAIDGVAGLAKELRGAADAITTAGAVLPGAPPDIPLVKTGTKGGDPNRMARDEVGDLFERGGEAWIDGDPWLGRWLASLYGQTVTDNNGRVKLTPFYAPSGQMSLRASLYEKTYQAMASVGGPDDALTGWARTTAQDDYSGANFDLRALRDSAFTSDGKPANQGAPSPTWLAVMAPLLMPIAERAQRSGAVGWQSVRVDQRLTARSVVWPIWDGRLDPPAIQTLLGHPALRLKGRDDTVRVAASDAVLRGLSIRAVYASSRSTLDQGDGPLAPARRIWPRPLSSRNGHHEPATKIPDGQQSE